MGWQGVRVIVADENGGELIKDLLKRSDAWTVKAAKLDAGRVQGIDHRQWREKMASVRRKTEESAAREIDQEAVRRKEICPQDRLLDLGHQETVGGGETLKLERQGLSAKSPDQGTVGCDEMGRRGTGQLRRRSRDDGDVRTTVNEKIAA